jgi:hypothetical protein
VNQSSSFCHSLNNTNVVNVEEGPSRMAEEIPGKPVAVIQSNYQVKTVQRGKASAALNPEEKSP